MDDFSPPIRHAREAAIERCLLGHTVAVVCYDCH
jgi:hypothetical protein